MGVLTEGFCSGAISRDLAPTQKESVAENRWQSRPLPGHGGHPRTLAENAGLDPVNTIIDLRKAHSEGLSSHGVNVYDGGVVIWQIARSTSQAQLLNRRSKCIRDCGHDSQNRRCNLK
ncbi:MAG: hypothetical protein Ct9H90mP14_2430 [Methanobacteriota archaeon]|nr:MAG: hypothetical protein Ct9H90mP14_2430 [Euryarchaeota archaeon]